MAQNFDVFQNNQECRILKFRAQKKLSRKGLAVNRTWYIEKWSLLLMPMPNEVIFSHSLQVVRQKLENTVCLKQPKVVAFPSSLRKSRCKFFLIVTKPYNLKKTVCVLCQCQVSRQCFQDTRLTIHTKKKSNKQRLAQFSRPSAKKSLKSNWTSIWIY